MSKPKDIFVALSYSSKVDYETGLVFPDYRTWVEKFLNEIEAQGHRVFCSLREDEYKINNLDKAVAFEMDYQKIKERDVLLAVTEKQVAGGVQNEIGIAQGLGKMVIIAHDYQTPLTYMNQGAVESASTNTHELTLPINFLMFNQLVALA